MLARRTCCSRPLPRIYMILEELNRRLLRTSCA